MTRRDRGATLIEVLVAIALASLLVGGAFLGLGMLKSARLREGTTLVASAVRVAYNHAATSSRVTRLVFDFDARTITMEESEAKMLLRHGDRTGGASGATELEKEAVAAADEVVKGPRAARAEFQPVTSLGSKLLEIARDGDEKRGPRELPSGVRFHRIEVAHEDEPIMTERVYLYFWPGGQAERAAIVLKEGEDRDDRFMTVIVHALTGVPRVEKGAAEMPRPRSDDEASEARDEG
ncbi:MAG: prepilin-type N-terminal cleavage/methylation domain-containing protein [Myxococcales bacterium]|nr:prepilin-type N-terminal cleavage/methylation domain-containing protein [Myxococcales bacterium]